MALIILNLDGQKILIRKLSDYSEDELLGFSNQSEAFRRYFAKLPRSVLSELLQTRHTAWLQSAAATISNSAATSEICAFWSLCADQLVSAVCDQVKVDKGFSGPIAVFAFGKWGAQELNLSSDIDLLVLCDDLPQEGLWLIRGLQDQLNSSLGDLGFRLDFDLRPGGKLGPLVPTFAQFEDYYGNYGEAWERLAFVRFRPIWGDKALIDKAAKFASKFSFRKHLDFSLLSDLRGLRQKIHSEYWHRSNEQQIDLKLGLGGIRDLELLVHTLQVVHGGKDPNLRERGTCESLSKLQDKNLLPRSEAVFLQDHYWKLRHWENLVQCKDDQQTHILERTSAFISLTQYEEIQKGMRRCDEVVSDLLGPFDPKLITLPENRDEQRDWLKEKGFSDQAIDEFWNDIFTIQILSRQKDRDEALKRRFLYLFIEKLSKQALKPDYSLLLLRDFLRSTRAKSSFFSLLLNQENLIDQLVRTFSTSPYLSKILINRPELLDSFILRTNQLYSGGDLESYLDSLSEHRLLSHFILGTDFLTDMNVGLLTDRCTALADEIAKAVLQALAIEMKIKAPEILALGKWGSRELGLRSDLDLIFVTEQASTEHDVKLARRWVNRMTEARKGGALYDIDFRLRPSGAGGIVVTCYADLQLYLQTKAEAWERQAYLRGRWLINKPGWPQVSSFFINQGLSNQEMHELKRIQLALFGKKKSDLDVKYAAGGIVDIELAVQTKALEMKLSFVNAATEQFCDRLFKLLGAAQYLDLKGHYQFLRRVEQLSQLLSVHSDTAFRENSEDFQVLSKALAKSSTDLAEELKSALRESTICLKNLDPRRQSDYENPS